VGQSRQQKNILYIYMCDVSYNPRKLKIPVPSQIVTSVCEVAFSIKGQQRLLWGGIEARRQRLLCEGKSIILASSKVIFS